MTTPYRPGLPPRPPSIAALPLDARGYPVPWFVSWIDGVPEFRVADGRKFSLAVRLGLCWVCGTRLAHRVTFPIGPMCTVNRISAEPPSHPECAEYSVRACPFLSRPGMVRREGGLPEEAKSAGIMIARNPGVTCLWTARTPGASPFRDGPQGGTLFKLWEPTATTWWTEGRAATEAADSARAHPRRLAHLPEASRADARAREAGGRVALARGPRRPGRQAVLQGV